MLSRVFAVSWLDAAGVSDFDALNSGKHHTRAQLYAFGTLAGEGAHHRRLTQHR